MNKYKWAAEEFKWLGRRAVHAVTGKYPIDREKYAGVGMVSDEIAKKRIYDGLRGDKPFAVGRVGFGEIGIMSCAQCEMYYGSKIHYYWTPSHIYGIESYSENRSLKRYHSIMYDAMNQMDCLGTYLEMYMCNAVFETLSNIDNITVFGMYIYDKLSDAEYSNPWTKALEGKKVLVVSPFYKEISIQYEKRNLLWGDGRIPECRIEYDPSIWIRDNGGFYNSLDILADRVLNREFDVALLGCGSLGLPIASQIKKAGRKAVVLGSALHLLFGIKGNRWDDRGIYNEYWIRPGEETKPSYARNLDNACYW